MAELDFDSFQELVKSGAQDADDVLLGNPNNASGISSQQDGYDVGDLFGAQTVTSQGYVDTADVEEAKPQQSTGGDVAVPIADYNRILFEARLQGLGDAELKMPWETGVMREIFCDDDDAFTSTGFFPFEYLGIEMGQASDAASASTEIAKSSVDTKLELPCYSFAVKVRPDLDFQAMTDALWIKSISKWNQVFEVLCFPGELGNALEFECLYGDGPEHGVVLRDALGIKSPRTAIKRAQTLLQYFKWLQGAYTDWDPWDRSRCLAYLAVSDGSKVAASRGMSLLEAFRFARFVMQIPIPDRLLSDAQLRGRAQRLMSTKVDYNPARPLKAAEVVMMEKGMVGDIDPIDKYMLGAALFCLYSRSRWSDIQHLDSLWVDRTEHNGEIFGFIETRTIHHKSATSLKKKRVFLPIVSPILGITTTDWTEAWFAVLNDLKVCVDVRPFGALCRAPTADGALCRRSVSSDEISAFLNRFLRTAGDNLVSSHSLKHTPLSWCSSYGMEEPLRTLLGHHELPGSKSMAVYSRDMLTRPLQAYCAMLANIRADHFRPDESRTSRLLDLMKIQDGSIQKQHAVSEATVPADRTQLEVPIDDYVEPATPLPSPSAMEPGTGGDETDDSDLASTSSDSSQDSPPFGGHSTSADFISGPVWRNCKSHVVHKCSTRRNQTICGRLVSTPNFEMLENGCSTVNARCSRCFKGEVVSSMEGLVDALDAAKSKRLKVDS